MCWGASCLSSVSTEVEAGDMWFVSDLHNETRLCANVYSWILSKQVNSVSVALRVRTMRALSDSSQMRWSPFDPAQKSPP